MDNSEVTPINLKTDCMNVNYFRRRCDFRDFAGIQFSTRLNEYFILNGLYLQI